MVQDKNLHTNKIETFLQIASFKCNFTISIIFVALKDLVTVGGRRVVVRDTTRIHISMGVSSSFIKKKMTKTTMQTPPMHIFL